MKKLTSILLSLLTAVTLVACDGKECNHTYDNACDVTCNECGEERTVTHDFNAADCDTPKTCSVCGATEGEATGHEYENDYVVSAEGHYKKCICHPELDTVVPHKDKAEDNVCDDCAYEYNCDFTVPLDREHATVKIELTNLSTYTTHTAYTNDNGVAVVNIPKGEYSLSIVHYNSGYIWRDKDNNVVLTEENNSYFAEFDISTERIEYVLSIHGPDGEVDVNVCLQEDRYSRHRQADA